MTKATPNKALKNFVNTNQIQIQSKGVGKEGVRGDIKIQLLKEELPVLGVNKNTVKQVRRVNI